MLLASITPQVSASDMDVGYAFVLPADNNAVVSTACQAVASSPEYVIPIEIRDTGSILMELRAEIPGLRAEELVLNSTPPPSGCLYDILTNFQTHSFARLTDKATSNKGNARLVSTSNGGPGY